MIPKFPKFKSLELSDKKEVENITSKFPPYSDFNFISMWSWDIKGEMGLSILNDNLAVKFTDYVTGKPFYSFIGDNKINETAETLLNLSKKEGLGSKLKLVPHDLIKDLDTNKFQIEEDEDNFDYIYEISKLAELKGSIYETHRNLIHQFIKINKNWKIKINNFREISDKDNILSIFEKWIENKKDPLLKKNCENEFLALNKLLSINDAKKFNLTCFTLSVDDKLIGFIINENVHNKYNIIHFEKADTSFKGCYPFLMQQNSKNIDIKYLNFEQDLGINSLKFTKRKFHPYTFLKKYSIKA